MPDLENIAARILGPRPGLAGLADYLDENDPLERVAARILNYDPGQARVPAGQPEGGQFASRQADPGKPGGEHDLKAKVSLLAGTTYDRIKSLIGDVRFDHALRAVGVTDGASVSVSLSLTSGGVEFIIAHPEYDATRTLMKKGGGLLLVNDSISVNEQGKGVGTHVLSQQIEYARRIGVTEMRAYAVGEKESAAKGGYSGSIVWPKMGYNGDIDRSDKARIRVSGLPNAEELAASVSLHELMSKPNGVRAMTDYYRGGNVVFDLRDGSRSLEIFNAYLEERKYRGLR